MAPRPVVRYGSRVLREVCRPAAPGAGETAEVLDRLWETLDSQDGVGLAAPQIGLAVRALVVRTPVDRGRAVRLEMINPRVVRTDGPRDWFEEGCLSFPGLYMRVRRPRRVTVAYHDRSGTERTFQDDGLPARVVLHEIDHLDGILFIDRVPRWRRWQAAPRLWGIRFAGIWRTEAKD